MRSTKVSTHGQRLYVRSDLDRIAFAKSGHEHVLETDPESGKKFLDCAVCAPELKAMTWYGATPNPMAVPLTEDEELEVEMGRAQNEVVVREMSQAMAAAAAGQLARPR